MKTLDYRVRVIAQEGRTKEGVLAFLRSIVFGDRMRGSGIIHLSQVDCIKDEDICGVGERSCVSEMRGKIRESDKDRDAATKGTAVAHKTISRMQSKIAKQAAHIARLEESPWICVGDRLPGNGERVITQRTVEGVDVQVAEGVHKKLGVFVLTWQGRESSYPIDYWQPIPPPKQ